MTSSPRLAAAVALTGALAGCYSEAEPWQALKRDHVTTTGRIVYVDCNSHGLVVYAFTAGGQEYRGKAAREVAPCQDAKVGDPLLVYYSPSLPGLHTSRTPSAEYEARRGWYMPEVGAIVLLMAWGIGASVAIPLWRRRGERKAAT
jgi:hypothetical protein